MAKDIPENIENEEQVGLVILIFKKIKYKSNQKDMWQEKYKLCQKS